MVGSTALCGARMNPTLCIVVPVFNEQRRLPALLDTLRSAGKETAARAGLQLEQVVVVDDGSSDGTPQILAGGRDLPVRYETVRLDRNRGKGAAVRAGMLRAETSYALMTDVDLSTPLDDLAALAEAARAGADVVIASRALPDSRVLVHQPFHRELMGKAFNVALRLLLRVPWRDTQCGFKLFRLETTRRLFELQRIEGFAFDVELLVLARRLDMNVAEVPVRWIDHPDTRVGLVTSSTRMALDALRVAYWARRPLVLPRGRARAARQ